MSCILTNPQIGILDYKCQFCNEKITVHLPVRDTKALKALAYFQIVHKECRNCRTKEG